MSYAWYPLNKVGDECTLLAYAEVRAGDEGDADVHVGFMVSLAEVEGQESFLDQVSQLEDYDDDVADAVEAELLAVACDRAHENWRGFGQFLDLALPGARQ